MFNILFLLFIIVPIVEIALLIHVGEWIGGWNTVAVVIATAFIGAHLVRSQGLQTLLQAQRKMQQGSMPGQEMAEGLLLAVSGILLVTPGFVTDGIGLLFAMPVSRPLIAAYIQKHLRLRTVTSANSAGFTQSWQAAKEQQSDVIEGEFVRKETDQPTPKGKHLHKPE